MLKQFKRKGSLALQSSLSRSSCLEIFCKEGVLGNLAKFTGKQLRQSVFFNKDAGLRPATLLKKWLWHKCFPENFAKFLRTPFVIEHLRWLLLSFSFNDCYHISISRYMTLWYPWVYFFFKQCISNSRALFFQFLNLFFHKRTKADIWYFRVTFVSKKLRILHSYPFPPF